MKSIQKNIANTTNQVILKIGNPVSVMVVLATLESFGIRNKDVFNDYGFASLTDLADFIYQDLKNKKPNNLKNINEQKQTAKQKNIPVSSYLWIKAKLLLQFYPLGIFHLMPIIIQIVTIIVFGYSLWSFLGFNIVQSTTVVFGVILGLILSGGYVQVLGRQASFYWHHQEYKKSKITIDKLITSGIKGMLSAFILLGLINFFFNLYPFNFIVITFIYAFLIGLLLLLSAPFYTIKKRWVISLSVLIATGLALLLKNYTSLHIYITHWLGILTAIIISKICLEVFFKKYKNTEISKNITPKKLMVIYKNYNYFFYGVLIYVFIFIDRLIAWSADISLTRNFVILYEKNYEIGMDLAILIFFLLAGVLEYAIASFSKFMDIKQKNILFSDRKHFGKKLLKIYIGHIFLLFLTASVAAFFIYLITTAPWGYHAKFGEGLATTSLKVCFLGAIGYLFLTWGMLNALYLFTLNRVKEALRALVTACIINIVIGFILSRTISYEYSVIGMLIGAVIFMLLTLRENIKFFKKLDYHYYAAY